MKNKLHHIGLVCSNATEAEKFWIDLLGFQKDYSFVIPVELSKELFAIDIDIPVQVVRGHELMIELFMLELEKPPNPNVNHICIVHENPVEIADKALGMAYSVVIPEKGSPVFIQDSSNNLIEIKRKEK